MVFWPCGRIGLGFASLAAAGLGLRGLRSLRYRRGGRCWAEMDLDEQLACLLSCDFLPFTCCSARLYTDQELNFFFGLFLVLLTAEPNDLSFFFRWLSLLFFAFFFFRLVR